MAKHYSTALLVLLVVTVIAAHWRLASIQSSQHNQYGATLARIDSLETQLTNAISEERELHAALNVFLPVPGLGEVKFSAEVPSEDVAKVVASISSLPGGSQLSRWLFPDEEDSQ